jgi:hypothetical protein
MTSRATVVKKMMRKRMDMMRRVMTTKRRLWTIRLRGRLRSAG